MKKLVMILGGQAVGKMTVGEALEDITKLKLFHNHMSVDLANHFYGFPDPTQSEEEILANKQSFREIRDGVRHIVFDSVGKSKLPGIIFTSLMAYNHEPSLLLMQSYIKTFKEAASSINEDVEIYVCELNCDLEERYRRNLTENRLAKKPSKRNTEWTKKDIDFQVENLRVKSNEEDIKQFNAKVFLAIDNTNLTANDTARIIKEKFNL